MCFRCVNHLATGDHVFGGRRVDKVIEADGGVFYTEQVKDYSWVLLDGTEATGIYCEVS